MRIGEKWTIARESGRWGIEGFVGTGKCEKDGMDVRRTERGRELVMNGGTF